MKHLNISFFCVLLSIFLLTACTSTGIKQTAVEAPKQDGVKLLVLYPQPTDVEQFESDYRDHLRLLHEKANISDDGPLPYTVTKLFPGPDGPSQYYQLFTMYYPSAEALQEARGSLQEVAADAVRISTGGPPVVMVGSESP